MMNFRKFSASAAIVLSMVCAGAHAQTSTWKIDPLHSSAEFVIRHLAVANVHGMITNVQGTIVLDEKNITKSSVTATLDTTTVNTGVEKRDEDLKSANYFDVAKYPTMIFQSTAITNVGGKLQLIGNLTLAGVTKSVTLDLDGPSAPQKQPKGNILSGFSASGIIKRSNFNFAPKASPPAIGDEVKLTIDVQIEKQ